MHFLTVLLFALEASAFPKVLNTIKDSNLHPRASSGCTTSKLCNTIPNISNAYAGIPKTPTAAMKLSAARDNCGGGDPCSVFNAKEQLVSVTGQYVYASPAASQIRGPCPGLNAASNHGYLPRSGFATITETVTGLGSLYGMAPNLAAFLAAYAIAFDGDLVSMTWSIGGPQGTLGSPSILGNGQGLSYSHNKYEGDSSIGRCDAYINNGDAHSLSIARYKKAWEAGQPGDYYTFDRFAQEFTRNTYRSEVQNPNYFADFFSTTVVSPAAYNFVIAFMSNHTATQPGGYLNGAIFQEFFAVKGTYPNFSWAKGQERVPKNWYRRPTSQPYQAVQGVFGDLIFQYLAYPNSFRFGGNTNGVNTYRGVNLTDFTGGVFNNPSELFQGDNLACFTYQIIQQTLPDAVTTGALSAATEVLSGPLSAVFGALTCPQVTQFNDNDLAGYPGKNYSPTGPATNC